ncbi:MAG: hypothetical protein KAT91_02260 [Candidatus Aenigmarchaeota archaeon]|nr:hypothetical protein [Candidatus Aenigmarchaeota archaeon]
MASEIVGKLEELGNLLVDCRDIPPVFFDEYGIKNFPKGPYGVGDFLIFPEHESGEEAGSPVEGYYKISLIGGEKVTHPENNRFNAMVLADLERAYYFSRTDIGCIGEAITLADLNYMRKIDGKTHTGYDASSCLILGNKILQIGRNENFRPETPHLLSEEEYAPELLKEFSGFLEEKHKGTHETVVKETGNLMKISLEGIGPLRLEIPPEDIDNLISRFTGLLQAYEETKNT